MRARVYIHGLRTVSETNMREHWGARKNRRGHQRQTTHDDIKSALSVVPKLPVTVLLLRMAPRKLDDDNLRGALKAVRDGVADWLGVDDGSPLITWEYGQGKASKPRYYGVTVEFRWDEGGE